MASNDGTSSATCAFLELPVEIRLEIYRHLLSSKYIKRKIQYDPDEVSVINTTFEDIPPFFDVSLLIVAMR